MQKLYLLGAPWVERSTSTRKSAAYVPQDQPYRAADDGIGHRAGAEGPGTRVHVELSCNRPVHDQKRRDGVRCGLQRSQIEARFEHRFNRRHEDRHVLRPASGHDGIDGDLLDGRDAAARRHYSNEILAATPGALDHLGDRLGYWRDDRKPIA